MPDLVAQSFTIKSPLDRPAKDFDAEVPGVQAFVDASEDDRITLEAGYRNAAGAETMVGQIRKGIVDEWEITLSPTAATTTVRGRDLMDRLLARPIAKIYPRLPAREVLDTIAGAGAGGGNIRTLTVEQAAPGRWMAQQIAADVVATVNEFLPDDQQLALSWETRDYEIRSDYSASGRPLDVLRDLADPWNQVPAFAIDVMLVGLTVVVRNRQPVPPADHVIALPDARITHVTITKRRPVRYGQVVLAGMSTQIEGIGPDGEGIVGQDLPDPTVDIEETPNRTDVTVKTPTGTYKYRMPDGVLLHAEKPVFSGGTGGIQELIKRETIDNQWTETEYDNGRPIRAARQEKQRTLLEGIHPKDKKVRIFRTLGDEEVIYEYDTQGYLVRVTALKREVPHKAPDTFEVKEKITKDYTDVASTPPQHEIVTTSWRWENKAGMWLIKNRDAVPVSGYRPGGPGGFKGTFIPAGQDDNGREMKPGENNSGQLIPVMLEEIISDHPDAEPFSYSNDNLTYQDLAFIRDQLRAASGLWEWELAFPGVTMPWIAKHVGVQFTGCRNATTGALIPFHADLPPGHLRPALIVDDVLRYVEGEGLDASSLDSAPRGVYWSAD
jgi:hypothetical protein